MAEDKKNGRGEVCACAGCHGGMMGMGMGYGRHWTFFLLRTLLTILILMIVFWFGVQVGRMNSVGLGYERGIMMMRGGYGGGTAMPMMRINGATSTPTPGVPNVY